MKSNTTISASWVIGAAMSLALAGVAHAQFPGDVLFESTAITANPSEDAVIKVRMFSGAEPFGAARWDVMFDETRFEIVEIRQLSNSPVSEKSYAVEGAGFLSIAVFNDISLTEPTGSVDLVELVVRPKFAEGESGDLLIDSVETLQADLSYYQSAEGFDTTITVVAPPATTVSALAAAARSSVTEDEARAARVPVTEAPIKVPAGTRHRVWKQGVNEKGQRVWSAPELQTYDPAAPSD